MLSKKSAQSLVVRVRRSRCLALYLILTHLGVAVVLIFALQGRVMSAFAIALLSFSAYWHWRAYYFGHSGHAIARVALAGDGTWVLERASGGRLRVNSNPSYFIGLGMIVLVWSEPWCLPLRLVLFPDSESRQVLRRLRVILGAVHVK